MKNNLKKIKSNRKSKNQFWKSLISIKDLVYYSAVKKEKEPLIFLKIKELLGKKDPIILELGSNIGTDTKRFLSKFKHVKIYCFEPDPRCIAKFKENINDKRCILIESAVSNKNGRVMLNLSGGHKPGSSKEHIYSSSIKKSISNPESYLWLRFDTKVEVNNVRLDDWIKENNIYHTDFIWSDIQGSERDMVEGAKETLRITRYLFIEYGETASYPEAMTRQETIDLMRKHNFELMPEFSSKEEIGDLLFKNIDLVKNK